LFISQLIHTDQKHTLKGVKEEGLCYDPDMRHPYMASLDHHHCSRGGGNGLNPQENK
jgi:hypothetical protein